MPDSTPDPYAVLKLPHGSSLDDVRKQYRRLARIYHPDRNPGDAVWCEEQLKELNAAFDLLSDPAKKSAYDTLSQTSAPARNGQSRAEQPEPPRSAASNGFHGAGRTAPAAAQRPVRRERRSVLPLLGASLAGVTAIGALIFIKSSQVPSPSAPATRTHTIQAPAPARHGAPPIHHEAAENVARHHRVTAHSYHRQTVTSAHGGINRAAIHPHAVRSHVLTAKQKDAVALRLAETAEARRRESSGRLKRISPQAMIRQMRNAARGL